MPPPREVMGWMDLGLRKYQTPLRARNKASRESSIFTQWVPEKYQPTAHQHTGQSPTSFFLTLDQSGSVFHMSCARQIRMTKVCNAAVSAQGASFAIESRELLSVASPLRPPGMDANPLSPYRQQCRALPRPTIKFLRPSHRYPLCAIRDPSCNPFAIITGSGFRPAGRGIR
jgi:hypothetical protein